MSEGSNFDLKDWQLRQLYSRVALLEETLKSVLHEWGHNVGVHNTDTFKKANKILHNYEFPKN